MTCSGTRSIRDRRLGPSGAAAGFAPLRRRPLLRESRPREQAPRPSVASIVAAANVPAVAVFKKPGSRRPFVTLRNPNRHGVRNSSSSSRTAARGGSRSISRSVRTAQQAGSVTRKSSSPLIPIASSFLSELHSITVYNKVSRIFYKGRAGVGRSIFTSTPTGRYYLVELLEQANPNGVYGPYAFGTSAYSNALYSFGGGPGQIGLHGQSNPASSAQTSVTGVSASAMQPLRNWRTPCRWALRRF